MKKALPSTNEVFIYMRQGKPHIWDFFAEEIVTFANQGLNDESEVKLVCQILREWMNRYLEEGITDNFLNDLNIAIKEIRYSKHILPIDLLPSETGFPRNTYIAQYDKIPEPEAYAADDFSKLLTSGELKRLKRCHLKGCENFFLGPPQARWCSKSCGSKFRVREKRKRDSS